MKSIIYDCDPGIDDALAMILAMNSGEINIEAITTVHGNLPIDITTNNALRILEYFEKEIPVGIGAEKPLILKQQDYKKTTRVHGEDGLGNTPLLSKFSAKKPIGNAVDLILEKINMGVRTLVATGALTNIALAFQKEPETMNQLKELIIMGGVLNEAGNIDRMSEANFYFDPHAADFVLGQKIKKILVPLNATHKVVLIPEDLNFLPHTKSGHLVKSMAIHYQNYYKENSNLLGCPLHDPLAMSYAINPDFLKTIPLNVVVETEGKYTRGMCIPELRKKIIANPNVEAALEVDSKKFLEYFLNVIGR